MALPQNFLDELRARLRPADVIGRRLKLTRKGHEHMGLCPFHKEKTPSFYVYDDHYHCFGCGAHGSVIDFVMETEKLSFREAVEKLAGEAGLEMPVDSPEERERAERRQTLIDALEAACAWFERQLRMPEGREGLAYLHRRGLDDGTISRFRLGYAPGRSGGLKGALARDGITEGLLVEAGLLKRPDDGRSPFEYFRDRVIFPIGDRRGRIIAFGGRTLGSGEPKYLNSPETPLFSKGRVLYALDHAAGPARKGGAAIVTEGYMDVIALHQAGFDTAVAPLGTALTEDQLGELWRLVPEPVLCFDGDAAGQRAAARALDRALPLLRPGQSLRFATLPAGEDPDSLIKREGPGAMRGVLEAANPLSETLWALVVGAARLDTPERKAAVWQELKDKVATIADPTVRQSFLETYKERFWRAPARLPGRRPGVGPAVARPADADGRRVDRFLRQEQVLLAILLWRPDVFEHVDEAFGMVGFADPANEALRHDLLDLLGDHEPRAPEEVRAALRRRGQGEAVETLLGIDLLRRMRRPRGPLSPEAPLSGLLDMWGEAIGPLRARQEIEPLPAVHEEMSDADLARLVAHKRDRLRGGE